MLPLNTPVVTGIGAVSPFGVGREAYFRGIREGRAGVGPLTAFSPDGHESLVAGQVPDFNPSLYLKPEDEKRVPRVVPMALAAAREALADAGIDPSALTLEESRRIGVLLGTGAGGIDFAENQYAHFFRGQMRKATPYAVSSSFVGMLSSELSIYLGLRGPSHVISTGCTSSTDAIGYAMRMIRHGEAEAVLTGGAEACITPGIMAGFDRMKVTSNAFNTTPARASRPFNADRDGFVLGEGAWILFLESYGRAKARGRRIYGTVLGYASTCDAFHRVMVEPSGVEAARALREAMTDARIAKERVGYVNLHGTSTRMNDLIETMAVKAAFDGQSAKLSTSATKSMIGHPQGACGAAGAAAALYALGSGRIPPTINYENPDPACDLDYTPNRPVERRIEYALCNCLAFGSKNSALVIGRGDALEEKV